MIQEKEYFKRRAKLAASMKQNSFATLFSAKPQTRSNDTEYPYRQNSNFYYLTGFKEESAILVIVKKKKSYKSFLFVQKKDKTLELWTGKRVGEKKAKKLFDVDDVFVNDEFDTKLLEYIKVSQNIYFDFSMDDERVKNLRVKSKHLSVYSNLAYLLGKQRLIKSDAEISLIKQALVITQEAHHYAMTHARTLQKESKLQASLEYIFKKSGAYSDAYTSIVACGNSANTLHYISNEKKLVNNKLILIDAGCEYEYYASDITRTIPVNGKFTPAQKELYSMVLDVQEKIITMIKSGVLRTTLQAESEMLLSQGMIKLGILKGDLKKLLKKGAHKKYYPHGIGHWMGIDVHDESPYKTKKGREIPLKEGVVLSIEPGIYCDENDKSIPKKYRGIGIRIEDDILVTKDGCENLSKTIAKTIAEIEALSS